MKNTSYILYSEVVICILLFFIFNFIIYIHFTSTTRYLLVLQKL